MNKKLIALVTSMTLLVGVTACSKSEDKNETILTEEVTTTSSETTVEETQTSPTTELVETTEVTEPSETKITVPEFDLGSVELFEVNSNSLNDGVWDDAITNTEAGENLSPDLTWDEVEGATSYVVYMVDTSASNWIHLKIKDVTTNSLEAGLLDSKNYVGPYPPSGTHDYVIYVFALRSAPYQMRGTLDGSSGKLEVLFAPLDLNESGESGNVIAYGMLTGTVTAK